MSLVDALLYPRPLKPKIVFKDLTNTTTTQTFDAFGTQTINVLSCRCIASLNHWGTFDIEVLDDGGALDIGTVDEGHRVFIDSGKTQAQLQRIFSGRVEEIAPKRESKDGLVYSISGYGYGIRFNERITNFTREARRIAVGSTQADTTDETTQAYRLLEDLLQDIDHLPLGEPLETQFDTSTIASGNVTDFIASIDEQLAEWSTIKQIIEDYSGAYVIVDQNDKVRLQYPAVPSTGANNFILKDTPDTANDLAAKTGYFDGPWWYKRSIKKQDGYANRLYAVVSSQDTLNSSTADTDITNSTSNNNTDICQKFTITSPTLGDTALTLSKSATTSSAEAIYIYVSPDNGSNAPNGQYVAEGYLTLNSISSINVGANYKIPMTLHSELDITKSHWYVMKGRSTAPFINWHHDGNTVVGNSGTRTPVKPITDASDWTISSSGPTYGYSAFLNNAVLTEASRTGAITKRGLVETVLTDLQHINDVQSMDILLQAIVDITSHPRINYEPQTVRPPDNPIMPGDVVQIIDTKLKLGVAGGVINPAVAQVVEAEYNFTSAKRGATGITLQVVGYLDSF